MLNLNTININHVDKKKKKAKKPVVKKAYPPTVSRINSVLLHSEVGDEISAGDWSAKCGMIRSDFFNVVKHLLDAGYVTKRKDVGESGRIESFFTRVKSSEYRETK